MNFVIHRKVTIWMLFIALSMLGVFSYKQLKMEMYPNAELPVLFVQINSSIERTPEYIEKEGVMPVEGVIGGLSGVDRIESYATQKRGMVYAYYQKNTDINFAYLKLQEKLNTIKSAMPEEFSLTVVKADVDVSSKVLMQVQVRGEGGSARVRNFVDQKITPEFENIDGIASVNVFGGQEKSVEVLLDRQACDAFKLTPARIKRSLSNNMQLKAYGGNVTDGSNRFFVYVSAEFDNVSALEDIPVKGDVKLKDIAEVYYGEKEETTISRINGKEAINLTLINDSQANLIDLSHSVEKVIAQLNKDYEPYAIEIKVTQNQAEIMEDNINNIIDLAATGGLLAIFILWVFLRNLPLISFVALAIPISVFTAFNFFYAQSITINSLTLVGIALAVGMLIDNSVVVLENIYRLRSTGLNIADAVKQGTKEVWRSVFAATLTTLTIFLPFVFSSNYLIKMLGENIGVSIISTLLVSMVVAMLFIPMVTHWVLGLKNEKGTLNLNKISLDQRSVRLYILLLKAGLRNPAAVVVIGIALFAVTILTTLSVSVNSKKEIESDRIRVTVEMSTGATLESTDEELKKLEKQLETFPEVEDVATTVKEEEGSFLISLKEDFEKINNRSFAQIRSEIEKSLDDVTRADLTVTSSASTSSSTQSIGGGGSKKGASGLQSLMGIGEDEEYVVVRGQDFEVMTMVAEDLEYYFEELENLSRVRTSVKDNQPEVQLDFDSRLMSDLNISRQSVTQELGSFQKEVASGITFRQDEEEYEIIIKYSDDTLTSSNSRLAKNKTLPELKELLVSNDDEDSDYELNSFSQIRVDNGIRRIERVNQGKQIEIRYSFNSDVYDSNTMLELARAEIDDVIASYNFPTGIAVEVVHEEGDMAEFKNLILIALLLIYMILAAVFESLLTPLVLLFSIPLAAIGSFLALSITGNSLFNANTLTGFLILLGVVVNNGIILIDFAQVLRKRGYRKSRAIVIAGLSRLRPILITAVTTCVAMLPLALGTQEYVSAIGAPFAITVIGGLLVSTILTLVFIPTLYSGLENATHWIKSLPLWLSIAMGGVVVALLASVYIYISDTTWQIINTFLVVLGVPTVVYFVRSSLRKANVNLIKETDSIEISIRNLVKVYERDSRFVREYKSGKRLSEEAQKKQPGNAYKELVWQIPLLGFMVYFAGFYLYPSLWSFMVYFFNWIFVLYLFKSYKLTETTIGKWAKKVVYYAVPFVVGAVLVFQTGAYSSWIVLIVFWYLSILLQQIREQMKVKGANPKQYKGVVKILVVIVNRIPFIGKVGEPFKALKGVSLDISTGMFGLLGPNGAGKSTLMRTIVGIYEQSYGKIYINGFDTMEKREELQAFIGFLPQEFGMYENMTSWEYLEYQSNLKGLTDPVKRKARIEYVLKAVHMWENKDKRIGSFSGGMKQRIGIAQILLLLPRVLIVDEPTAGLDPRERIRFRNLLVELSQERVVIFSTHIIEDISSSCNNMAVLKSGNMVYKGSPTEMVNFAIGHVWSFYVDANKFEEVSKQVWVIHHIREGQRIRVRCLAENKPFDYAEEEIPVLEDAYLYLLRKDNLKS